MEEKERKRETGGRGSSLSTIGPAPGSGPRLMISDVKHHSQPVQLRVQSAFMNRQWIAQENE